jgi:citrate synthase
LINISDERRTTMELHLRDLMTPAPLTTAPTDTLAAAAAAMRVRDVSSAVVVHDGTVVGILTERDLTRAVAAGAAPATTAVTAWMTPEPVTGTPDSEIPAALERMLDRNVRHLPVCTDGVLVGTVSLRQLVRAARLRRVDPWAPGTAKGLENVTVAETRLSHIDATGGRLVYAGHDAVRLAAERSFEDVWYLLLTGALPRDEAFARRVAGLRGLPLPLATLRALAADGAMMPALEGAMAATGATLGVAPWYERDRGSIEDEAVRLGSVAPSLVAALWRLGRGLDPVPPDPTLGHAANYLWMLHGERPAPGQVRAAERYLILAAEHGMNASTFTARVIASTGADVAAALVGAAGALSGPLHGGAPSLVLDMLDDIGTVERAGAWIAAAIASGRRIMGFGHRVYRTEDPRAACLRATAEEIGAPRAALARAVEREALAQLRAAKPDRVLATNVEFWAAVALEAAHIPRELFTPTFAVARMAGWTAHVLEQVGDNRLIRPAARYVGPPVPPAA